MIRSRPCTTIDANFPRLVLEVHQSKVVKTVRVRIYFGGDRGSHKDPKGQKKFRMIKPGGSISLFFPTSNRVKLY